MFAILYLLVRVSCSKLLSSWSSKSNIELGIDKRKEFIVVNLSSKGERGGGVLSVSFDVRLGLTSSLSVGVVFLIVKPQDKELSNNGFWFVNTSSSMFNNSLSDIGVERPSIGGVVLSGIERGGGVSITLCLMV